MVVNLHSIPVALYSSSERVQEQWRTLFDYELESADANTEWSKIENGIDVEVKIAVKLAPLPNRNPDYISHDPPLRVYVRATDLLLVPSDYVQIELDLRAIQHSQKQNDGLVIHIMPEILDNGGLEDVVTLALAPYLRRRGFYMVHAFTAAHRDKAVMFSGPSGHGKTTAGLTLVTHGWSLLANDVALLSEKKAVYAALSPGTVHVAPATLALLPQLAQSQTHLTPHPFHGKVAIPRASLLTKDHLSTTAKMTAVYFPEIDPASGHQITVLPRAVGLARLMESSMDQWDRPTWQIHVDFLERLSHQVAFRKLTLGRDLDSLPHLIEQDLSTL